MWTKRFFKRLYAMNKLEEIKEKLRNELCLAFICNDKSGYIDCYYDKDQEKNMYYFRYGTDEYYTTNEDAVFTFPFVAGKSLSESCENVEIQLC